MTGKLRTETAFDQPDAFYDLLIQAHEGLSEQQSAMMNAKFMLLLANHIGDLDVLREALALARTGE